MADKTVFEDDWFYFEEDAAKKKRGRKRVPQIIGMRLPGKVLRLRLAWFPENNTSCYFADILGATLYHVKDEWECFLKRYLKKRSQIVLVICDGRRHAAQFGIKPEWDFAEFPVAFSTRWHDLTTGENRGQRVLIVRQLLDDDAARTCAPLVLVQYAVAWLTMTLLEEVGGVSNQAAVVRRFCDAIRRDVNKMLEHAY